MKGELYMKLKTVFKYGIIVLILGGAAYGGYRYFSKNPASVRQNYYTEKITIGDVTDSISATGTIEPEELINVGAQVQGMIRYFGKDTDGNSIDYRSKVTAGMVLAVIDDTLYSAAVKSAEANLLQRKAELTRAEADLLQLQAKLHLAEQELKRAEKLRPSGAMAQADYDTALSAKEVAEANIAVGKASIEQAKAACQAAEAQLARERSNLNYCTITSPVDGVVIDRRVNVGQTVVSSMNTPSLFLIAKDLKKMQVWVSVNEADIGKIKNNMKVEFTVDTFPGEIFHGTVGKIRLNASLTQNVVTYIVEVQVDNSSLRLIPYLTANVRFIIKSAKQVKVVSNAALRWVPSKDMRPKRRKGVGTVWTIGADNKPVAHTVKILMTDGIRSAVETNLPEGTVLITGIAPAGTEAPAAQQGESSPFLPKMGPRKR